MLRPHVSISVLVAVVVLLAAMAPLTLGANSDYDIHIDGSVDTVDRTKTTSYGEFDITEVGRVGVGESVTISVDAPAEASYSITVLDDEQRIRRSRTATGDATATFDTDGLETGTYAVSVGNQSTDEIYQVEPLVVKAYDVTVDSETTVETDATLDVTVELTQVESGEPIEAVQVALTNDSADVRVDATRADDGTYTATVPTDEFEPGDYSLYAVVRSGDEALGANELVGLSDERAVDVTEQSSDSSGGSSTGGGSSGSDDGGSADTTETDPTTETVTESTETTTQTSTATTETETTTETTETRTTETKTTTDNVVTPNEPTTTSASTTTSSELPNTGLQALFGLLVAFAVGRRLSRD